MSEKIQNFKNLFAEKKYKEIIDQIKNLKPQEKTPQISHILGICKVIKDPSNNNNLKSAREDFRETFLKESNTNLGIEALSNFINISTDLLETKESLSIKEEKLFNVISKKHNSHASMHQQSLPQRK